MKRFHIVMFLVLAVCWLSSCKEKRQIPDHTFIDQSGDTVHLKDFKGNAYVVNFFFTSCPGICIALSSQMERVQAAFIDKDDVKLVSVSVDESRDSVSVLKAYADAHNAREGQWYFLRGKNDDVKDLAQKGFGLIDEEEAEKSDFVHSDKLVLVDKEGRIEGYYNGLDSMDVDRLITDIRGLQ